MVNHSWWSIPGSLFSIGYNLAPTHMRTRISTRPALYEFRLEWVKDDVDEMLPLGERMRNRQLSVHCLSFPANDRKDTCVAETMGSETLD